MEKKFNGTAKEAREITRGIGAERFKNFIYKRIRQSAEEGNCCVYQCYGGEHSECIDDTILKDVYDELRGKGYKVTDILDDETSEKTGDWKIEW